MRRSPGFLLLAVGLYLAGGIAPLAAQENPPEVTPDTLESTTEGPAKAPLPLAQPQPTLSAPPAPFYHPPVIRELWRDFYRRLDGLEDGILTKKFVQALLDSLAESVQADFDSLAVRSRALDANGPGHPPDHATDQPGTIPRQIDWAIFIDHRVVISIGGRIGCNGPCD